MHSKLSKDLELILQFLLRSTPNQTSVGKKERKEISLVVDDIDLSRNIITLMQLQC